MNAILRVAVKGCDRVAIIERTIDIPFVPIAGMSLCGITHDGGNIWEWPIKEVHWNVPLSTFIVYMEDDTEQVGTQTASEMIEEEWGNDWAEVT